MIVKPVGKNALITNPLSDQINILTKESGTGVFVSTLVTLSGGNRGLVELIIDGNKVVSTNLFAAITQGLTQSNYAGIIVSKSSNNGFSLAIQFNEPLLYEKDFQLHIIPGHDSGIVQVTAHTILGSGCKYPG